jgi:DsbC/DsbD-like thiol-disulfide interchange protein
MAAWLYPEGRGSARRRREVSRRRATIAATFLAALLATGAQAAPPSVKAHWKPADATSGSDVTLTVTLEPGWHVNANDPDQPYLIPTVLEVEPPSGSNVEAIRYPKAVVHRLAFAPDTALRLYEGTFTIDVRLAGVKPERFAARLNYQACNAERCLPPRTLDVPYEAAEANP